MTKEGEPVCTVTSKWGYLNMMGSSLFQMGHDGPFEDYVMANHS